MLIIRPAGVRDIDALVDLARLSGPGFTSLPEKPDQLRATLEQVDASFAADVREPGLERYMLMLEDTDTGQVLGCAGVKATVGIDKPFFNFRLFNVVQTTSAAGLNKRFDLQALILVNEFRGASEVGSLFLRPEGRGRGAGRLLAQSRYLLIASDRARFADRVIAELRGIVQDDGHVPFWDHVINPFFDMPFDTADTLSGTTDKQFILDLMPKYPIYTDLLHAEARAVIGKTHPDGRAALSMLEWEGFQHDNYVDIFDGGPLVAAPRDLIRTIRESTVRPVEIAAGGADDVLLSTDRLPDFRVTRCTVALRDEAVTVDAQTARVMQLEPGDRVRIWRKST